MLHHVFTNNLELSLDVGNVRSCGQGPRAQIVQTSRWWPVKNASILEMALFKIP